MSVGSPGDQPQLLKPVAQLVIPPPQRPASAQAPARSAVGRGCLCRSLPLSSSHIETIRPGLTAACLSLSARDTVLSSKPDLPSSRSPLRGGGRPAWPHLCSPGANFRTFYLCPLFCSPLCNVYEAAFHSGAPSPPSSPEKNFSECFRKQGVRGWRAPRKVLSCSIKAVSTLQCLMFWGSQIKGKP